MEFWDVYDKNRKSRGHKIMRGGDKRLRAGEYHLTAHVCIFSTDGRMLLQRRANFKGTWGGLWDITAGGSVLAGENTAEGAERELFEELGIVASFTDATPFMTLYHGDCISDYFILKSDVDIATVSMQSTEVQDVKYATRDEVMALLRGGGFLPYKESFINLLFDLSEGRIF